MSPAYEKVRGHVPRVPRLIEPWIIKSVPWFLFVELQMDFQVLGLNSPLTVDKAFLLKEAVVRAF